MKGASFDQVKTLTEAFGEPGIVVLDRNMKIQCLDRGTLQILGGPPLEELVEGPIHQYHSTRTGERIMDLVRQARETQRAVPFSLKLVTRSGDDRFILVKVVPMLDPSEEEAPTCVLLYDISEAIAAERELIRIPVSVRDEIKLLRPDEVTHVRAANIYSEVFTRSASHHCDLSLGALEKRLPDEAFFRIHRSYMVNLAYVRGIDRNQQGCRVQQLDSEAHLPVSRDRSAAFVRRLGLK